MLFNVLFLDKKHFLENHMKLGVLFSQGRIFRGVFR